MDYDIVFIPVFKSLDLCCRVYNGLTIFPPVLITLVFLWSITEISIVCVCIRIDNISFYVNICEYRMDLHFKVIVKDIFRIVTSFTCQYVINIDSMENTIATHMFLYLDKVTHLNVWQYVCTRPLGSSLSHTNHLGLVNDSMDTTLHE
jgi:hypothetical protein